MVSSVPPCPDPDLRRPPQSPPTCFDRSTPAEIPPHLFPPNPRPHSPPSQPVAPESAQSPRNSFPPPATAKSPEPELSSCPAAPPPARLRHIASGQPIFRAHTTPPSARQCP